MFRNLLVSNILNWHLSPLIFCCWSNSIFVGNLQIYLFSWDNFSELNVTKSRKGASSSFRMLIKMSTRVLIVNCWRQQVTLQCQCRQYIVFCREKHFVIALFAHFVLTAKNATPPPLHHGINLPLLKQRK